MGVVDAEDVGIGILLQCLVMLADTEQIGSPCLTVGYNRKIDDAVALAHHRNRAGRWQQTGLCAAETGNGHLAGIVFHGNKICEVALCLIAYEAGITLLGASA